MKINALIRNCLWMLVGYFVVAAVLGFWLGFIWGVSIVIATVALCAVIVFVIVIVEERGDQ